MWLEFKVIQSLSYCLLIFEERLFKYYNCHKTNDGKSYQHNVSKNSTVGKKSWKKSFQNKECRITNLNIIRVPEPS